MKRITLLLFIAAATFASCNKSDDTTPPTTTPGTGTPGTGTPGTGNPGTGNPGTTTPTPAFAIDGVRDVKIDESATSNVLTLLVNRTGSRQEPVALSVTGLPKGITATFDPANGTPNYTSKLTFSYDYSGTGGTYPVKLIGTSDSGKKEYTFNIVLPTLPANGWVIGTKNVNATSFGRDSTWYNPYYGRYFVANSADGRVTFNLRYDTQFPRTNATYTLVDPTPGGAQEMSIMMSSGTSMYSSVDGTGNTVSVTYSGGKYSVRVNTMMKDQATGAMTRFIANLSE